MAERLGIDFGTSHTVAFLGWPDGRIAPLLFEGTPVLPSAVCVTPAGEVAVGQDAVANGIVWPQGYEPHPKRRVMDHFVLLSGHDVPVVDLVAAVLRRVADEAVAVAGHLPAEVVCTCPAGWGGARRGVLSQAAEAAGLGRVTLVDEPSAAATVFAAGDRVPPGAHVVVYDLGGGTFDASVVRRTGGGFEVVATEGLVDAGGLDIDARLVEHIGEICAARDAAAWHQLMHSADPDDVRARLRLWADTRTAKHMLSRSVQASVHVPVVGTEVTLVRDELDRLATPILQRTVTVTEMLMSVACPTGQTLAGIFLVGGGSRMPLVATLLHRRLGVAPTVGEQPDLVVARGALAAPGMDALAVPAPPSAGAFPVPSVASGPPVSPAPPGLPGVSGPPALPGVSGPPALPEPSLSPVSPAGPGLSVSSGSSSLASADVGEPVEDPARSRRTRLVLALAAALTVLGVAGGIGLAEYWSSGRSGSQHLADGTGGGIGVSAQPTLEATGSSPSATPTSPGPTSPSPSTSPRGATPTSPKPPATPRATANGVPTPQCTTTDVTYTDPNVPSSVCLKVGAMLRVNKITDAVYNASSRSSVLTCTVLSASSTLECKGVGPGSIRLYVENSWALDVTVQ